MAAKTEKKGVVMHHAKPGRCAWVCTHKDHKGPPQRIFTKPDQPAPKCKDGHTMRRQRNNGYRGEQIPS